MKKYTIELTGEQAALLWHVLNSNNEKVIDACVDHMRSELGNGKGIPSRWTQPETYKQFKHRIWEVLNQAISGNPSAAIYGHIPKVAGHNVIINRDARTLIVGCTTVPFDDVDALHKAIHEDP